MKSSFLIVESPFQLLCAYEAKSYFDIEHPVFFVRYSRNYINDLQMDNVIKFLNLDNIEKIFIRSKNKSVLDYLKIYFYKVKFQFLSKSIKEYYVGNYKSRFIKTIICFKNRSKIVLLDDGSKTINIQKEFSQNYFFNFFTCYNLRNIKNQNLFENQFSSFRKRLQKLKKTENIILLGSKLHEVGLISEEYYIELVNKISNYFKEKTIIYIPHREENKNKIQIIDQQNKNIIVKELLYPVELLGIYENEIPYIIASFYSSALYTMHKIYDCKSVAFSFDYSNSTYKCNIDNIYEYYKKYMKVVRL